MQKRKSLSLDSWLKGGKLKCQEREPRAYQDSNEAGLVTESKGDECTGADSNLKDLNLQEDDKEPSGTASAASLDSVNDSVTQPSCSVPTTTANQASSTCLDKSKGENDNSESEIARIRESSDADSKPYQPKIIPSQFVNNRKFNFQTSWYSSFPWMHYESSIQKILCFSCRAAKLKGLFPEASKFEETFVLAGFNDWKHGLQNLKKHDDSKHHADAVKRLLSSQESPIAKTICGSTSKKQQQARVALKAIFTTIIFLAKQGLALRGCDNATGNFKMLLQLRANEIKELKPFLSRKNNYTSGDIQNDILRLVSHSMLRKITKLMQEAVFYSLIVDETTDSSVHEQVSISVRIVSNELEAEEYFLGLYETPSTTGAVLTKIILDSLMRFDLKLDNLRGQCYDGARNMSGEFRGVQSRILSSQPKALYVHCFNHSLNLALQDTVAKQAFYRDVLYVVNEIGVILKASPKRMAEFSNIVSSMKAETTTWMPRLLCPTRWTVRVNAIKAIIFSYEALIELMENLGGSNDSVASKAAGIHAKMMTGEFYLGLLMSRNLFEAAEILSRILQDPKSTVSGSIEAAKSTIYKVNNLKTEKEFDTMWNNMKTKIDEYSLAFPELPRIRRKPNRFRSNEDAPSTQYSSSLERLRSLYFDSLDKICDEISHRFQQPGLQLYEKLENGILNMSEEDESNTNLMDVCTFYDWNFKKLCSEFRVLRNSQGIIWTSIGEIVKGFKSLKPESRCLFPVAEEYLKHLLVIPCSSAGAERSFSRLRRVKSYLRTSMGQERLNHCCVINCYSDIIDELNLDQLLQSFSEERNREPTFGNFI